MLWGVQYVLRYHLFKQCPPLICGLVLTNQCNLRCRHCRIPSRDDSRMSFRDITTAIGDFYQEGGRCLYLHGGEPLLWHEGRRTIDDIVDYAHQLGFFTVVIYTNGTLPLQTRADTVFVSMDGLQNTHDHLRGESFTRIMDNISNSPHAGLFINFTINRQNKHEIEEFLSLIHQVRQIRGTFFYFHTPYYGHDELYIEPDERVVILRRLLQYKSRYRILNSRAGLRSALTNSWKRPLAVCSVHENRRPLRMLSIQP